jgi:class 3 adenylate cyclase
LQSHIPPIELFLSYAHTDEELTNKLITHLSGLQRQGMITTWYDRKITAGQVWGAEIDAHLESSRVILFLVSAAFVSSNYCNGIEVTRAMERHESKEAIVIPIWLRPVDCQGTPFAKLQGLPANARPVTTWSQQDMAFLNIANGIRSALNELPPLPVTVKSPSAVSLTVEMKAERINAILIINASMQDFDTVKIGQLLALLQNLSDDRTLKIQSVEMGSVKVTVEGSREGIARLQGLFRTGQLRTIFGYEIDTIQYLDLMPLGDEELPANRHEGPEVVQLPVAGTRHLPDGDVTFLMTDIERSSYHWEQNPEGMKAAVARHNELADQTIAHARGILIKSRGEGDSLFSVFSHSSDAVLAALELQRALLKEHWPLSTPLRVRMSLHTGEVRPENGDYFGPVVNRCARLRSLAHGGQVLLSKATHDLSNDHLPPGTTLKFLGEASLRHMQASEQIYQLVHPDLPAEFPPLPIIEPPPLPVYWSSCVGREHAVDDISRWLITTPLVTLSGTAGSGKTRLAVQVAEKVMDQFTDGVWYVALKENTNALQTVAPLLQVSDKQGQSLTDAIGKAIHTRSMLLLLDNCDQTLPECKALCQHLVAHCRNLRILVTSRERLGLERQGERVYNVSPLSRPPENRVLPLEKLRQYEAVQLFVKRAEFISEEFALTEQNAAAVAQICARLDGLPSAIELAAPWVNTLAVEQFADMLSDRFTYLPELRDMVDLSYNLLTPVQQQFLRRAAIFAGSWTLQAAQRVCSGSGIRQREVSSSHPHESGDLALLTCRTL